MHRTALLLCALFAVSFGCNCGIVPPNPHDNFCRSDFVGVLSIVSRQNATSTFPYITYVGRSPSSNTIFKSPNNFSNEITIVTQKDFATSSGACGVNWLEVGKAYLLSGRISDKKLSLNVCLQVYADELDNVPESIKKPLQNGTYKNNCAL
ncbi:hypothetical protein QR680_006635 [Steinernema hermaphroditum]|uniref:NTR domain-containing protein n=1 Tax=Steinernema hermaphroditum TaxID=289476 RepID=A0AA39LXR0_9BILA|nr:hypothetical protein QR680_006635 [Steinernema hermaphroditum]